jgi:hypothetical protein
MVVAAPIKIDMIAIMPKEPMPMETISRITSAQ